MKLLQLEIHNIRGIWDLELKPSGENLVIHGPNGAGKSAVVDAIDFLLTGRISRLTGQGTGGITLRQHGPHILHRPEEATVRAVFQIPGMPGPVEIKRCIAHPDELGCDEAARTHLEPILSLAARGQHVLTRRAILKYITAEAGTRAQQIQELLSIADIEEIRRALVHTNNDLGAERQAAVRAVEMAKPAVKATLQQEVFDEEAMLAMVNQIRLVLGGEPIASLASADLKSGLVNRSIGAPPDRPNIALIEADVAALRGCLSEANCSEMARLGGELQGLIATLTGDADTGRSAELVSLMEMGLRLIDESGRCPLCGTPWPAGDLQRHLQERLGVERAMAERLERMVRVASAVGGHIREAHAKVIAVRDAAVLCGATEEATVLELWLSELESVLAAVDAPIAAYVVGRSECRPGERLLAPADIDAVLQHILVAAQEHCPAATAEQTAWDTLTRLEENLKALEGANERFKFADLSSKRAALLLSAFQRARDAVLGGLYHDIRDRFVALYRQLHATDEEGFSALLEPEGAGLKFEVGFHGQGSHPPQALHSEGHQDSMGLCLYLALAERLNRGLIELVILDDVVMSVDAEHRRDICRLLATSFPDRQFLITTHDRTWAYQLKTEGVVRSRDLVEFCNWHLQSGPVVSCERDLWTRLEQDLAENDVPAAAARLRRGLEQFYSLACDALQAPVKYRLSGQWELGDLLPAARGQLGKLIRNAKAAANSRDERERVEMLGEVDSVVTAIYARTVAEQWGINASVHYNRWAELDERDFRPIVEAFRDLEGVFVCAECGGMLSVVTRGVDPVALHCNCGKVDWSLVLGRDGTRGGAQSAGVARSA